MIFVGTTESVGNPVGVDAAGLGNTPAAGDFTVGVVVSGSSGSTGRFLSVFLQNQGSTEQP